MMQLAIPSAIRRTAERFSRHVAFRKRLPKRFGNAALVVTPDSRLRMWTDSLESLDAALLATAAETVSIDDHIWDIGANVGVFSFAAAAIAGGGGSVLAVEPDLTLVRLLRKSIRLQPPSHAKVDVLPAAIFSAVGISRFQIARRGRASNAIDGFGRTESGGTRDVQLVPTLTLDSLLPYFAPPRVIKIDVEGAELHVLQGASTVLARHRPALICEVGSECAAQVTDLLQCHGYDLYDYEMPVERRSPLHRACASTLAIPKPTRSKTTPAPT